MVCLLVGSGHLQSISGSSTPFPGIRIDPVEEDKFLVEIRQDAKMILSEDDKEVAHVPIEHRAFDQGPPILNKFDRCAWKLTTDYVVTTLQDVHGTG